MAEVAGGKQENSFEIVAQGSTYLLSADTKKEMKDWIDLLSQYAKSPGDDKSDDEDSALLNVDMQQILRVWPSPSHLFLFGTGDSFPTHSVFLNRSAH